MGTIRGLLSQGNAKVGEGIHLWGLPAVETCPGMSSLCEGVCYARKGRFRLPTVRARLTWNLERSRRPDFADAMAREVRRKGCLVVRVHSAGDFYDAEYAEKWLWVMRKQPKARYYFYSRSWRQPDIAEVLGRMAALKCVRAWYSVDSETGTPPTVPPGVRLAYLRVDESDDAQPADLVFRVRGLRAKRVGLDLVCPHETPRGRADDVNCGSCRRCWE